MTTARNTAVEPQRPAADTPGDNRGAEDLDGNKAGAKTGNKAKGPDAPEAEADSGSTDKVRNPRR